MNLPRARRFVAFGLGLFLVGAAVIAWTVSRHAGADLPVPAGLADFGAFVNWFRFHRT